MDDQVGPIVHDGVMYLSMPGSLVQAHGWIARVARLLQPEIVWPLAGTAVFVFALPEDWGHLDPVGANALDP